MEIMFITNQTRKDMIHKYYYFKHLLLLLLKIKKNLAVLAYM